MLESFKKKLTRGDLLIGAIMTLPSTEIAEIFSLSGFDWLFVDLEHSALDIKDAQHILQTVVPRTPCLIRVPSNDEIWIKKALDIGASGIIVPQVKTKEEANRAVQLCKYPPKGTRSVGIARAHEYGKIFQEYVNTANNDICVILQIEHIDGVGNISEILEVPGIDCLFIGPYDLSASLDKLGVTTDSDVQSAISEVKKKADQSNVPLGIFGATIEAVQPYINEGYSLIAVGIDTLLIEKTAKKIIQAFK